jgi:hypothetical protein
MGLLKVVALEHGGTCDRCGKDYTWKQTLPAHLAVDTPEANEEYEELLAYFHEWKKLKICQYCLAVLNETALRRFWTRHEGLTMR